MSGIRPKMTRRSVTCETWDVVVVPFPFTDSPASKRRPALVLSSQAFNHGSGHSLLAQITKAKQSSWPGDFRIQNVEAGLPEQCIVRMKLFTIDNRLIQKSTGRLSATDPALGSAHHQPNPAFSTSPIKTAEARIPSTRVTRPSACRTRLSSALPVRDLPAAKVNIATAVIAVHTIPTTLWPARGLVARSE